MATRTVDPEVELLRESIAELELALDDEGWKKITGVSDSEFSRAGLGNSARVARVMAVANPLIKRGLSVRQAYVFGQGVEVQARSGEGAPQDVNAVVRAFWEDEGTKAALSGDQAQEELERTLGTDGNVFIACFTNPRTGFVQPRSIPFDEIVDVISNPDDKDEPWLYRRQWLQREAVTNRETGATSFQSKRKEALYPSLRWRPATRAKSIEGIPVMWDAPILHISVNRLDGWAFGIGDAYAALPWARAYRDFLGDWAILVKSLSQFAWKATSKGSRAQQLRQAITRRPGTAPVGNENSVGGTAVMGADVNLEAIPKSGATIDSESGKPLAAMVAAALDVPVTVLLADPGQTGARAVAETLEWPTMLAMMQRQSLWASAYRSILDYVLRQSVKAPQGPLKGTITRDAYSQREVLVLAQDTDPTIEVTFPPLDELPMGTIIDAIVAADGTGKVPPLEIARLLLRALGVEDIDTLLDDMTDDDGRWVDPLVTAGQVAADAFRRGQDPSEVV